MVNSDVNIESINLADANSGDASAAFQSESFDSTIGERLAPQSGEAPVLPDAPKPPEGIDAGAWDQVKQFIADDKLVMFTEGGDGIVPDYILGPDGQLIKNPEKTEPSADGAIRIQVDGGGDPEAAKQKAKELQVAAVREKIFYWQRANPGEQNIPEYLKGMLAAAQSGQGFVPEGSKQLLPEGFEQPKPQNTPDVPSTQPSSRPNYGIGGGQRVGRAGIGNAPSRGYRDGNFNPSDLPPMSRDAIPPPVEGDLNIKGPPSCTAEQIQDFLVKGGSPAAQEAGFSQALYDACVERGIDPAIAVGFFLQESTLGRYGRAPRNKSLGNIKGRSPESGLTDGTFRKYNTWAEGARDWARLIDETYHQKWGLTSLSQVINTYAPSSDGNNVNQYVATVNGVVQNFKQQNSGTAVA